MNGWKTKSQLFILCLLTFLPLTFLNATRIVNNNLLEFSLSVTNQSTDFNFTTNTYEANLDQLGISWYEPVAQKLHLGLEVGYIEMSQIENSLISAQFTSGEYAGLLLRFFPIDSSIFTFMLSLNYRYNRTEGKSTAQMTQFVWYETQLSSEFQFHPTPQISLFAAAEHQFLDGEQRDSGSISQLTTFTTTEEQGYRFGINFKPNPTGIVSVEWMDGFRNGVRVYLTRKF